MTSAPPTPGEGTLRTVSLDSITPGDNHRKDLGDLAGLAESIRQVGILEPPIVRPGDDGGLVLVAGERRLSAARMAGLDTIEVVVRSLADLESRKATLAENCNRLALNATEAAAAYQEMLDLGMTEDGVAALTGVPVSIIRSHVSLLQLPAKVRRELSRGAISYDEALLLTELADTPDRLAQALKLAREGWSLAAAVREQLHERERAQKTAATLAELERRKVRVIEPVQETYSRTAKVQRLGSGWGCIPIRVAQHAREVCHAAFVDPWSGAAVFVCDQPQRHAGTVPGIVSAEDRKAERAAKRAATVARKQAIAERQAVLTKHLASAKHLDRTAEHVQRVSVLDASDDTAVLACELLGVEVGTGGWRDHVRALADLAASSAAELRRIALTLALARGELYARREYTGMREDPLLRAHLTYVTALGYAASDAERAFLEAPPRDADTEQSDESGAMGDDEAPADDGAASQ